MMFQFYFKKMGSSETLKDLTQRKLSDLVERFVGANGLVRITFQTDRSGQKVLCYLQGHNGQTFQASATSDNMYANLDAVAHKLEAQLNKVKTRMQKQKSRFDSRLRLVTEETKSSSREEDFDLTDEFEEYETRIRSVHWNSESAPSW